jgi:hypothetical protein
MVVSVGRAIAVTASVAAVSEAATASITPTSERRPSATKPGVGPPPKRSTTDG